VYIVNSRYRCKVDRQKKVAELRLGGVTDQATIARMLGTSQPTISRDFADLDVRFRERADEMIEAAKGIDLNRLDAMIAGLWTKAITGDTWSVDRVLKCLERRANLLGLDAPQKRELSGSVELRTYAQRVAADLGLEPAEVLAQAERIIAEAAV
jgi:transcriptional regulator